MLFEASWDTRFLDEDAGVPVWWVEGGAGMVDATGDGGVAFLVSSSKSSAMS
jgi:hypothetical protein